MCPDLTPASRPGAKSDYVIREVTAKLMVVCGIGSAPGTVSYGKITCYLQSKKKKITFSFSSLVFVLIIEKFVHH